MRLTGVILIILAAAALSWAIFSAKHPFSAFPADSNPAGSLPETGTRAVSLYFPNAMKSEAPACPSIFPVERHVGDTPAIIRDTISALIAGPLKEEAGEGYRNALDATANIRSIRLEDGLLAIDFDRPLAAKTEDACALHAAHAEVEATLRQFPGVTAVMISSNGQAQ